MDSTKRVTLGYEEALSKPEKVSFEVGLHTAVVDRVVISDFVLGSSQQVKIYFSNVPPKGEIKREIAKTCYISKKTMSNDEQGRMSLGNPLRSIKHVFNKFLSEEILLKFITESMNEINTFINSIPHAEELSNSQIIEQIDLIMWDKMFNDLAKRLNEELNKLNVNPNSPKAIGKLLVVQRYGNSDTDVTKVYNTVDTINFFDSITGTSLKFDPNRDTRQIQHSLKGTLGQSVNTESNNSGFPTWA